MKQVRDTKAGKSISAYVILNEKGEFVAKVQAHYSDSGVVTVDVWDRYELAHQGRAGGYGYDKFTAALSGCVIDGRKIYDHCGTDEISNNILLDYQNGKIGKTEAEEKAKEIGASFANYDSETGLWSSLFYYDGLRRLEEIGYTVIQAI